MISTRVSTKKFGALKCAMYAVPHMATKTPRPRPGFTSVLPNFGAKSRERLLTKVAPALYVPSNALLAMKPAV